MSQLEFDFKRVYDTLLLGGGGEGCNLNPFEYDVKKKTGQATIQQSNIY